MRRWGCAIGAMFELMYSSGLRVGEVGKLDRGDIDLAAENADRARGASGARTGWCP